MRSVRIKRRSILNKKRSINIKKRSIRFKKKKSDGMMDDSIEDKAEKIIKYIKNIDAFKSLGVGLTEVLNEFIKQADPELITIINSVEYESYKPDKQQLFFIVFIQQIIINDIIFVEKFFPLKGESYKAQLPDDERGKNLYYIFEFYGLFLKITRTDVSEMIGGASKKRKVKSIIENLFFVFDYDDELYEIEKGEGEKRILKSKRPGEKNVISSYMYGSERMLMMDILIDIYQIFDDESQQKSYLSLYKQVVGCLRIHFKLNMKRKIIEEMIDIHSSKTLTAGYENDKKNNIFFLIFFTKCSGYSFGERIERMLPMSLITGNIGATLGNLDNYYMFFHHIGNKLREETRPYKGMSLKKINYIMDLFYDKNDKDDENICKYDLVIVAENPDKIVESLFKEDKKENPETQVMILKVLFEFLFLKYYIYFNTSKFYSSSQEVILLEYNSNIVKINSLFDFMFNNISNKSSREMLFKSIIGFFEDIMIFHNFQKNVYKCYDDVIIIKYIFDDINIRTVNMYKKYKEEMKNERGYDDKVLLKELEMEPDKKEPNLKNKAKKEREKIKKADRKREEKERTDMEKEETDQRLLMKKERKLVEKREEEERKLMEKREEEERKLMEKEERDQRLLMKEEEERMTKLETKIKYLEKINECLDIIDEYKINPDCLNKTEIIDDYKRATYVIFGELFYEYIAFLTDLLQKNELFYIIVMGCSSIEKQCDGYKTGDVDVKFIPYNKNTNIIYNDDNYNFIIKIINIFKDRLNELFQTKFSSIYEKIKGKFDEGKLAEHHELQEYKDALHNSSIYSLIAECDNQTENFGTKKSMYRNIKIKLRTLEKDGFDKDGEPKYKVTKIINTKTIMDVSIYYNEESLVRPKTNPPDEKSTTNFRRKLMDTIYKTNEELFYKGDKRVPNFIQKNRLNLVDLNYLKKEKELLMNSDLNNPVENFIDVDYLEDKDKKEGRHTYVKNKSREQFELLQKCV